MVVQSMEYLADSDVEKANIQCPDCRNNTTQCCECGQWTAKCECAYLEDVYCVSCSVVFFVDEDDEREWATDWMDELATCECDNRYTTNLICDECKVYRVTMNDPWLPMDRDFGPLECVHGEDYYCDKCGLERASTTSEWDYVKGAKVWRHYKCRHYDVGLQFPDGVTVYASSKQSRKADEPAPDFGLYLDSLWYAASPAYFIDWPDFGLPTRWDVAARCIIDAYKKAEDGLWVEVGCIGGHGRTGTVLACMAVLSGLTFEDAINFVRLSYCSQAIESDEQEWYVEWFDRFINGGTTSVKTSFIVGHRLAKDVVDEVHEFQYEGMTDWRDRDMVYASGQKPTDPVSELSKSKYVTLPKEDDDNPAEMGHGEVFEYCDVCNMVPPCFCKNNSPAFESQIERIVDFRTNREEHDPEPEEWPF